MNRFLTMALLAALPLLAQNSKPKPSEDDELRQSMGEAGSSPIVAAASQGQDVKLFWILDDIADAEALIARNGSGIAEVGAARGD
jgi:hypothetical protein